MPVEHQDSTGYKTGDKVRIRTGSWAGERGIIAAELDGILEIQLESGTIAQVQPKDITNYSLAARRAWQAQPKQAGRPRLAVPRKRMVSIRIDIDIWEQLGQAAEAGLITNREQAINQWLMERLAQLRQSSTDSDDNADSHKQ